MKIAAIIPARYQSTRFEGKPLALIKGIPMIQRVYRQVEKSGCFESKSIFVATDDERIASVVKDFGGNAVMTSPDHTSGSERLWEVVSDRDFDALINIQGDEPIVPPRLISDIYDELKKLRYDVVTPVFFNSSYEEYLSRNAVKVVINREFFALYFSRSPIPYMEKKDFKGFYHHVGMYGYLKSVLNRFINFPKSQLETTEKLEQLRFLDNGIQIKTIATEYSSIGVDVPGDIARVEEFIKNKDN